MKSTPPRRDKSALLCVSHFWPSVGGLETAARQLADDLDERGWDVTVLTSRHPARKSARIANVHIIEHSGYAGESHRWTDYAEEIVQQVESGRYSAYVLLADPLNWLFSSLDHVDIPSSTRVIIQPVINEEGFKLWGGNEAFCRQLAGRLRRASAVTTLTEDGIDAQVCRAMGIAPTPIPNCASPRSGSPRDFREVCGIPETATLLLQVANFWPVKNHCGLLRQLRVMGGDWHLALIGNQAGHDDYFRRVKELADSSPRVSLHEGLGQDEVAGAMQAGDLLLLPSDGEVAPIVVLEAMSHGLPWLATPRCGSVWEQAGGIVAELEQFPLLIGALTRRADLAKQLGELGRQHWRSAFTPQRTASAWVSLLTGDDVPETKKPEDDPRRSSDELSRELRAIAGVPTVPERPQLRDFELVRQDLGEASGSDASSDGQPPLVSVIVATKDRPALLLDALRSLVEQTYDNWEAVVVNDGGADVEDDSGGDRPETPAYRYLRHPARAMGYPPPATPASASARARSCATSMMMTCSSHITCRPSWTSCVAVMPRSCIRKPST